MVSIFVFSLILFKNHKITLPNSKYKIKNIILNINLNEKNFYVKTWRCWGNQIKKTMKIFSARDILACTRARALINIFTPVIQSLYIFSLLLNIEVEQR